MGNLIKALIWLCASAGFYASAQVEITNFRSVDNGERVRLVFETTANPDYRKFHLANPNRMVLDFTDTSTRLPAGLFEALPAPLIKVRAAPRGDGVRIVFDLDADLPANTFELAADGQSPHRVVVDLNIQRAAQVPPPPQPPAQRVDVAPSQPRPPAPPEIRDIVVVIDPGHGGKDPGALGVGGVREKDLVLRVAQKLKAEFDELPGFRAELTRSDDRFIPLPRRTQIAREKDADFFVSLHADSFPKDSRVNGAGVFALSLSGATSETARWLAQRENAVDLSHGVELGDVEEDIRRVLLNMSMDSAIRISKQAGTKVLNELGRVGKLHRRQLDQANFVVLRSPDMPSLLVELGFLSSEKDARRLADTNEQRRLAAAIRRGIVTYFEASPPANTRLYVERKQQRSSVTEYTVKRGDTLSRIASEVGVSLNALRRANDLVGDNIRIGQKLDIPRS